MSSAQVPRYCEQEVETVLEVLLENGGHQAVPVLGSCMCPALGPGDLALVEPFLGLPRPGEIVAVRAGGIVVIRRLRCVDMRAGRRVYRLAGEVRDCAPSTARRDDLLGRVRAVVRQGRRLDLGSTPGSSRGGTVR